jgi:hypothetical protein
VYPNVADAVDEMLRGAPVGAEERRRDDSEVSARWRKTWGDAARFAKDATLAWGVPPEDDALTPRYLRSSELPSRREERRGRKRTTGKRGAASKPRRQRD